MIAHEKDKLIELAGVLYEKVKENASIDWTIKESVKAKLKVIVKLSYANTAIRRICKCWRRKRFLSKLN
jgi:hypothetical protein